MLATLDAFRRTRSLAAKIVGSIVLSLALMSALSFWITQHRVQRQAEDAFTDKLRVLTEVAEGGRLTSGEGGHAWQVSQKYAETQGYTFRAVSTAPNDPKDTPNQFEQRAIQALQSHPTWLQYSERTELAGQQVVLYAKPVEVRTECQACHSWKLASQQEGDSRQVQALFSVTAPAEVLAANQRANAWMLCLTGLSTLGLGSLIVFLLVRKLVARPLNAALTLASGIARNDLTVEDIVVESDDEVGQTSAALNRMKHNLAITLEEVVTTASRVAQASKTISETIGQQSAGCQRQKQQADQVASAMHQIAASVTQVCSNSQQAASASEKSSQTAKEGGQIVAGTLAQMESIAASVSEAAGMVEGLGKNSDQIGRIIGVIQDIADQTNLLALNAAIEAARAGEQGRGFAVVSDEVRKLAERTTQATREISGMIEAIQRDTQHTVTAMHTGTGKVQQGVQSTSQAGDSLHTIIEMSEQVGQMISQIATAATEQSSAAEEVAANIEQIAKITHQTAEGAQQSAQAVKELSGMAQDLQELAGRFKLSANELDSAQLSQPELLRSYKAAAD